MIIDLRPYENRKQSFSFFDTSKEHPRIIDTPKEKKTFRECDCLYSQILKDVVPPERASASLDVFWFNTC